MARHAPELACPRCGYDVSGVVPTWKEACPLDGLCSECGLTFAWVDIYRPERLFPAWSFEHARRRRIRALVRTVFKTLRPRRLWTEMSLAAPMRRGRLIFIAAMLIVLTHAAAGGIALRLAWGALWATTWWVLTPTPKFMWDRFALMLAWPYSGQWWTLIGPLGMLVLVWGVLVPLPYLVLVDTMAKARCRPAHLLRGWVYFLPTLAVVLLLDAAVLNVQQLVWGGIWNYVSWTAWLWVTNGLVLAAALWYVRWWWQFTSVYLRLEQARLVLTLMMVISFLAALAICTAVNQDLLDLFGGWINLFFDPAMMGTGRR